MDDSVGSSYVKLGAAAAHYIGEENYWLGKLSGEPVKSGFPYDFNIKTENRPLNTTAITFNGELAAKLMELSSGFDQALHMIFVAAVVALLDKYTYKGNNDIIVGVPIYRQQVEGEFINTVLPIRCLLHQGITFKDLLLQVRQTIIEAVENQNYPMETLLYKLNLPVSGNNSPLFDTAVLLENIHQEDYISSANPNLIFSFSKSDRYIEGVLKYNSLLYQEATAERISKHLVNLINTSVFDVNLPVSHIDILSPGDKKRLLYDFNQSAVDYPHDKTLHELFAGQVEKTPGHTVVKYTPDLSDIYTELNRTGPHIETTAGFERCCFKKNPYIFRYENDNAVKSINLPGENNHNDVILLLNHKHHFVLVNRLVLLLLDYFDGKTNLISIFNGIKGNRGNNKFYISVVPVQKDAGLFHKNGKEYVFSGVFEELIVLIKEMYRAGLIELVDDKIERVPININLPGPQPKSVKINEEYKSADNIDEYRILGNISAQSQDNIKSPVVLIGDTPGVSTTGLVYIASYLRRNGIEAYTHWYSITGIDRSIGEETGEILEKIKPRVVGISMKWFTHMARVLEICRLVKAYDASIDVVLGGNTASYYWKEIIEYECVDYVILGDGEVPLLQICKQEKNISNCAYKRKGRIIKTGIDYVQDEKNSEDIFLSHLDEIFVYQAEPFLAPNFFIPLSKGCAMQCFYCAGCRDVQKKAFNRPKPFNRGINEVRRDLEAIKTYTSTIMFDSDIVLPDVTGYYRSIWQGIDLANHFCTIYLWELPPAEFIRLITATFKFVYLNIDLCSLSQEHRRRLSALGLVKPQASDKELFLFFDECEQYDNLQVIMSQVAGLPYFSGEDIKKSDEILEKIIDRYSCFNGMEWGRLHAQPGAPVTENCEKYDLIPSAKTFKEFLYYSELNLKEDRYPGLGSLHYPYIYLRDDNLNSKVSKYYAETNKKIAEYVQCKTNRVLSKEVTYRELNKKSNQLAERLREKGVRNNTIVAILVHSSLEMITGIMGILKAGGAYLPIDLEVPRERIISMLADSNVSIILTAGAVIENEALLAKGREIIYIDDESLSRQKGKNPVKINSSRDLAYTIFTSGSTGKPKGVVVEHRSAVNTILCRKREYNINTEVTALQLFSYAFDGFVTSFFTPVSSGACLVILNQRDISDINKIKEAIRTNRVTHFICVPALYSLIVEYLTPAEAESLKVITLAGDKVSMDLVQKTLEKNKNIEVAIEYGVTEAGVMSSLYRHQEKHRDIKIGKPTWNTKLYILNKENKPLPLAVPGELCIGGIGVARGYLNKPELTAEKFDYDLWDLQDYQDKKIKKNDHDFWDYRDGYHRSYRSYISTRVYKTGDLARWLADGNIEFLGRIDHQVKIRGLRIEPGEIEHRLLKAPGIREAVVLLRDIAAAPGKKFPSSGEKFLCAYYVSDEDDAEVVGLPELRQFLAGTLPEYMIPAYFFPMERLPLTPNGKLDRNALPKPEIKAGNSIIGPENPMEEKLQKIWSAVLNIEPEVISMDSDFFQMGGHSLKAMKLITKIHKELNVKIQLADIFNAPSVRALSQYLESSASTRYASIELVEKKEYYALSSVQKRLYILQQVNKDSTGYNTPQLVALGKSINKQELEKAAGKLIHRHETFRTSFVLIHDEPRQRVCDDVELEIAYYEYEAGSEHKETQQREKIINRFVRPFDLGKAPLIRVGLISSRENNLLMVDIHHIAADGESLDLIQQEFFALFNGRQLPSLRFQYKDYALWQHRETRADSMTKQEQFWLLQFAGELPVLNLPTDYTRPTMQSFAGAVKGFAADDTENRNLRQLAKENECTLFITALALFTTLLSKLGRQEDIIIGTPISGRNHPDLENIIGMFVNTVVLRNFPGGEKSFKDFLTEVKETTLKAFENQDYPFEDLVEKLAVKRDTSRNPLFDVMLQYDKLETQKANSPTLPLKQPQIERNISKFDLTLFCTEVGNRLFFTFEYCTQLFTESTIACFIGYFREILSRVSVNPDITTAELLQMSPGKKREQLARLNERLCSEIEPFYNRGNIFQDRLIGSLHKYKNGTAVVYGNRFITYEELDKRSDSITRWILNKGIGKGMFIGLLMENRQKFLLAVIGILKANCVFVSLDPALPDSRLELMIKDTALQFIMIDEEERQKGKFCSTGRGEAQPWEWISIDDILVLQGGKSLEPIDEADIRETVYHPEDQIYVYFTSGTTGNAKAIVGKNKSLLHFIDWEIQAFGIGAGFRFSQFTTPGFDAYLRDVFVPLCSGGTTCTPGSSTTLPDPGELIQWIDRLGVQVIHCVPSLFRLFNSPGLSGDHFKSLKYIMLSGEKIYPLDLVDWYNRFGDRVQLVNFYGPTETTMIKTYYLIRETDVKRTRIPIGQPMTGARVMILDENLDPCDRLITGNIYIRTPFRTFGYCNEPGINGEKFFRNPFNDDPGDLLHATGDIGRFLPDGNIDLLGRNDRQVKIRGIRVELEEIETALLRHTSVKEAAVVIKEILPINQLLCAYIEENPGNNLGAENLESHLKQYLFRVLPGYMVPSRIIKIEKIPRKPNGKKDYDAMSEPGALLQAEVRNAAPGNPVQAKLHKLWSEILGVPDISITSSFFEVGGNSLNVMKLITKIHKTFDTRITLGEIFNNSTIERQAEIIIKAEQEKYTPIKPVEKKEYYPLTSAQERLYFLQQVDPGNIGYNIPSIKVFAGNLDKNKIEQAFKKLIHRHEILRTSFELVDHQPVQKIHPEVKFQISSVREGEAGAIRVIRNFIKPFDLARVPLCRVKLIETIDNQMILLMDIHHILVDGLSTGIIVNELMTLYLGGELPGIGLQYKDYVEWRNSEQQKIAVKKQEGYWLEEFKNGVPVLQLPTDDERPEIKSYEGDSIIFQIGRGETAALFRAAQSQDATMYMVLLATYYILLSKLSGQEDIVIGAVTSGRRHTDLDNILGMFANTLALRNSPGQEKTFARFLADVKDKTLNALENQDYPLEMLVDKVMGQRDNPGDLFRVIFNYVEQSAAVVEKSQPGPGDVPSFQFSKQSVHYDLSLECRNIDNDFILMNLKYSTAIFKRSTIEEIVKHFQEIIRQAAGNQEIKIEDIAVFYGLSDASARIEEYELEGFGF